MAQLIHEIQPVFYIVLEFIKDNVMFSNFSPSMALFMVDAGTYYTGCFTENFSKHHTYLGPDQS